MILNMNIPVYLEELAQQFQGINYIRDNAEKYNELTAVDYYKLMVSE